MGFWERSKRYFIGAIMGIVSIASIVLLSMTHTLEGIFIGWWLGSAIGYLAVCNVYDQYVYNKQSNKDIIEDNADLLNDEAIADEEEYKQPTEIESSNRCAQNYIQKLTHKKENEKIENRTRAVGVCIFDKNNANDNCNEIQEDKDDFGV